MNRTIQRGSNIKIYKITTPPCEIDYESSKRLNEIRRSTAPRSKPSSTYNQGELLVSFIIGEYRYVMRLEHYKISALEKYKL